MSSFVDSSSWKRASRWLAQLDLWIKIQKERQGDPNRALPPDPQTWFAQGAAAFNQCLHPSTVHAFRDALQARESDIDTVMRKLTEQDMAWQPDPNSTECISGATLWRMVISTMAFRANWDFGELANREKILTSFLGQWESTASPDMTAWHRTLCETKPWAMATTFDWLVDRKAPEDLQWVIEATQEPSTRSMTRLVHFCLRQEEAPNQDRWQQLETLRPELSGYIKHYLLVHEQLTGEAPDLALGAVLAQSWKNRADAAPSIAPDLFGELVGT